MKTFLFTLFVSLWSVLNATSPIKPMPPPEVTPPPCITPCPFIVKTLCAGPTRGCGELMNFDNSCFLANYNCQHPLQRYEQKYNTTCYPNKYPNAPGKAPAAASAPTASEPEDSGTTTSEPEVSAPVVSAVPVVGNATKP